MNFGSCLQIDVDRVAPIEKLESGMDNADNTMATRALRASLGEMDDEGALQ